MQPIFERLSLFPHSLLIVGGHALDVHGVSRQTIDVDCLIAEEHRGNMDLHLRKAGFSRVAETGMFARYRHASAAVPEVDVLFVDVPTFAKLESASIPFPGGGPLRTPCLLHLVALKLHAIRNNPEREARDLGDIAELLRTNRDSVSSAELSMICQRYGVVGIEERILRLLSPR